MIQFEKFTLTNGLKVIVHHDNSSPLVAMNILYNVGARDEDPEKTGFAHLFEHLMFGGSLNIPNYDEPLQQAGAENNAFTSNDFTNYYLTIPSQNIETGFWLESDRMLNLAFSEKSLEVQRHVVIEEFKQRYLNQPFGDVWLNLRPLAYKVHPYQWATIGKEISHIENASLADVKSFFKKYYTPQNAIMCLSGDIDFETAKRLSEKWFEPIPSGEKYNRNLTEEPIQTEKRTLELKRKVPVNAIYKSWHCCARGDKDYFATEMLTDVLSRGKSSRLFNSLVKDKKLFSSVNAYMLGELEKSMVVMDGKLNEGVTMQQAEEAIDNELNLLKNEHVPVKETDKIKRQIESGIEFSNMSIDGKALNLCFYELLGDANGINQQALLYNAVSGEEMIHVANQIFTEKNSNVIYYYSES